MTSQLTTTRTVGSRLLTAGSPFAVQVARRARYTPERSSMLRASADFCLAHFYRTGLSIRAIGPGGSRVVGVRSCAIAGELELQQPLSGGWVVCRHELPFSGAFDSQAGEVFAGAVIYQRGLDDIA